MAAHLVDAIFPEIAVEIVQDGPQRQKVQVTVSEAMGQYLECRLTGRFIVDGDIEPAKMMGGSKAAR